jgi:nucleoside phosphorylase
VPLLPNRAGCSIPERAPGQSFGHDQAQGREYTVVVTQLIETGNPDAAITTTKVVPRWRPRSVLMVGITGGVQEKAALGDVVLSQYAHYYPPAKRKASAAAHRFGPAKPRRA